MICVSSGMTHLAPDARSFWRTMALSVEVKEVALFAAAERSYGREHTYWARANFCLEDITLTEGQGVQWFTYDEIKNMQLIYEDNIIVDEFFRQRPFESDIS
jgi:8-oxo-dGTP diphosphatase